VGFVCVEGRRAGGSNGSGQECDAWWFGPCHDGGGLDCYHQGKEGGEGEEEAVRRVLLKRKRSERAFI